VDAVPNLENSGTAATTYITYIGRERAGAENPPASPLSAGDVENARDWQNMANVKYWIGGAKWRAAESGRAGAREDRRAAVGGAA
jgi:hypothetical protein